MVTPMINLPVELIQEIVTVLSTPEYPLQYGHKHDVKHALLQLCHVNHFLLNVSRAMLYSTIVISSHRELNGFLSTPPDLHILPTSLWLRNFSGRFSNAADLIRVLGPKLRRLALDIAGNELDASATVREAMRCCTRLEDFTRSGYSPMQVSQPRPFWPDWMGLRRLALDGPLIDTKFIEYIRDLPHLSHLALIEPRWRYSTDGTEVAIFTRLLTTGTCLQKLLLIYCAPDLPHLNSLKRLRSMSIAPTLRNNLDVLYMIMKEPITGMTTIRHQIGEGSLWSLDTQNLFDVPPEKLAVDWAEKAYKSQVMNLEFHL